MSSNESSIKRWQSIDPSERDEIALVHVEIAHHRRSYSNDSAPAMESLKDILRDSFHAVAKHRGGKLFSWDGNGGAFLFPVDDGNSYDNCCVAALQMLEMMPSFNQDFRASKDPVCPIEVRISCDAATVAYDPVPSNIPGDLVTRLAKHGRQVSVDNRVTISDRIYRQLTRPFKARFASWKYSTELEVQLYRSTPLQYLANPHDLTTSSHPEAPSAEVDGDTAPPGERPPAVVRLRNPVGRVGPWHMAGIALVVMLVAGFLIVRAVLAPAPLPAVPAVPAVAATPPWEEQVRSPEWIAWREHVHEKLSTAHVTEDNLGEVVRVRPPGVRAPPAAALRHDQAVGDVLLSYPGVRQVLRRRLGIDEQFLGTGFSNPVNMSDYESASLHEYLIPNLPDDNPRVWMRKLKLLNAVRDLDKTIKEVIQEDTEQDDRKQELRHVIIAHGEAKDRGRALIRFAILDMKKEQYKGTLGRPESVRVFASDLAEVWSLKVRDAADRSGYTLSGDGDTFFVWIFVPAHKHEAVTATWGQVLEHLPKWLEAAQNRRPWTETRRTTAPTD